MHRRDFLSGVAAAAIATQTKKAFAATDAFVDYDGMGQAELVRSGQVSSQELVEAAIKRVEKLNPILNAVVHKLYDAGRAAAQSELPDGPFKGVPYLIKDLSELNGAPLTFGSRLFQHNIGRKDNGSVARAKQAGLVIIGKSNTPEFGFTSSTESVLLGAARNPYNTAYHSGGSSGGAGAAVASGMVPFAHASDGGGSIRIPASINGLVGLKPSRGRLFVTDPPRISVDITTRFAVSRSVRDTAQMLNAAELKGADATLAPVGFVNAPASKRLKIAVNTKTYDGREAAPPVRDAIRRTALLCRGLGHEIIETNETVIGADFLDNFMNIWSKTAYDLVNNARIIGLTQGRWVSADDTLEPFTHGLARLFKRNVEKDPDVMDKAVAYCDKIAEDYAAFFQKYDVFLTPVLRQPPLLIGEQGGSQSYDAMYASVADYVGYTPQYNAAGVPAISLPLYTSSDGLPIGSQFATKLGGEATLLHLAYELERARPWATRWPEISAKNL